MTSGPKKAARPKVPVPLSAIQEHFRIQLKFLRSACEAFDSGDRDEFSRIALHIRILVYDHGQSKSVAGQLGLKSQPFMAYSPAVDPTNMVTETPMVMFQMGQTEVNYLPWLDQFPMPPRMLTFDNWWSEDVFSAPGGISMARSGFVLHTADQAGGAHVDPALDEDFHRIANGNEAGWVAINGGKQKPMADLEKAYVRQIGFDVLQSLEPAWERIKVNRLCDCGSGKKLRYCCARLS